MAKSSKKEGLNSILKTRIDDTYKTAIETAAHITGNNSSEIVRACLKHTLINPKTATSSEAWQFQVQCNVMINQIHNSLMANPHIPKKYKEIITKEFSEYVQC